MLADGDEMINLYRGSTIDASCEVLVHLANWFQRGIIFKISQTEKRITCGGIFVNGSGPKKEIVDGTCHRCFLQILDDLARRFQRRRILEIDQSETIISCGGHVC